MRIFVLSSAIGVAIAVVAYFVLTSTGMDTASVMSGSAVRL